MNVSKEEYARMAKKASRNSRWYLNAFKAFAIGGAICLLGQILTGLYMLMGAEKRDAAAWCSVTLIAISVLLTALGKYEKIAKQAGAGTLVPITGFANAVAAPAVEFKTEGYVLGVGAKIFSIAGPVILYGTAAGVVYGILYALFG
ncbi:MAG: SpoVA/SpoVAEb family sporulation membrane protein [Ruminococcus sp.]|nr:SpoVA/SpoVAEb family sporulation membrane protein [Ruminococcus sp.]